MESKEIDIQIRITELLLGRAPEFEVNGRRFQLFPPTLGKMLAVAPIWEKLKPSQLAKIDGTLEAMRLCVEHKTDVCRLIAYYTLIHKADILSATKASEVGKFFEDTLSTEDLSKILLLLPNTDIEDLLRGLNLDKEAEERRKIFSYKNNTGDGRSVVYGGKSIYGSLIVPAAKNFGYTLDYILWGISYANLKMMLADEVTDMYLTKEEVSKLHVKTDKTVINADDKEALMKAIKSQSWK